jgi:hypothetical protein
MQEERDLSGDQVDTFSVLMSVVALTSAGSIHLRVSTIRRARATAAWSGRTVPSVPDRCRRCGRTSRADRRTSARREASGRGHIGQWKPSTSSSAQPPHGAFIGHVVVAADCAQGLAVGHARAGPRRQFLGEQRWSAFAPVFHHALASRSSLPRPHATALRHRWPRSLRAAAARAHRLRP